MSAGRRRLLWLAGIGALVTVLAVIGIHRASPRSFVSAHGMLHTAVVHRFASPTSIAATPPENPFFAGRPLPYYWFFHYSAARLMDLLPIHPLQAIELLVVAAVVLAWFSGALAGRALYGGVLPGVAIGLFTFVGANPFGAGFLGARFALHGTEVFADDPHYLWGIVHPVIRLARFEDPFVLYGPLINFFLNTTSRPLALALLVFVALALVRYLRGGRARWLTAVVLGSALCTAFAPIIGLAALPVLAAALCAAPLIPSGPEGATRSGGPPEPSRDEEGEVAEPERRRWWIAATGLGAGVALALPTYSHLLGLTGGGTVTIGPSLRVATAVAVSAGLLGAMAAVATWRARGFRRRFMAAFLGAAAVLIAASVIVRLPVSNDSNFFHAGVLLLGVPAAGVFAPAFGWRPRREWLAAVLLLLVFLPTPLVVLASYLGRPAVPLSLGGAVVRRIPETDPWARAYAWIRDETAADAVFITDPRPPLVTAVGNFPELPALTERFLFTTRSTNYVVSPNADAGVRERIATRLVDGRRLAPEDEAYLDALDRPIYVIREAGEGEEPTPAEEGALGPEVFRAAGLRVHAVR